MRQPRYSVRPPSSGVFSRWKFTGPRLASCGSTGSLRSPLRRDRPTRWLDQYSAGDCCLSASYHTGQRTGSTRTWVGQPGTLRMSDAGARHAVGGSHAVSPV